MGISLVFSICLRVFNYLIIYKNKILFFFKLFNKVFFKRIFIILFYTTFQFQKSVVGKNEIICRKFFKKYGVYSFSLIRDFIKIKTFFINNCSISQLNITGCY